MAFLDIFRSMTRRGDDSAVGNDLFPNGGEIVATDAQQYSPQADGADGSASAVASDGVQNAPAGLGTGRDKRAWTLYGMERQLSQAELDAMYAGSWRAARIVNAIADDMTRAGFHVMYDDDGGAGQFDIEGAIKRFGLVPKVRDAVRWARLYGGAVIVIGTRGEDASKPLDMDAIRQGALEYLLVLDRWRIAGSGAIVTDPVSHAFGMPEMYTLSTGVRVHPSRVVRFDGEPLPWQRFQANGCWNAPVLQHVFDAIRDADASIANVASMMYEATVDVIKIDQFSQYVGTRDGQKTLEKRIAFAGLRKAINRVLLLDKSEEHNRIQNTFAGLDNLLARFQTEVAGASGIPVTRLMGQSPAGLQATGDADIRNYYDAIRARQESDLRPQLEKLLEIIARSEFGSLPENFRFEFNPLWQLSEREQADVERVRAERDRTYIELGVVTEGQVARELFERGTYRDMTEDDVTLVEEMSERGAGEEGAPGDYGEALDADDGIPHWITKNGNAVLIRNNIPVATEAEFKKDPQAVERKFAGAPDGTYDPLTGEPKHKTSGYQATFRQTSDAYTPEQFRALVKRFERVSGARAEIGVYRGSPEVSFTFTLRHQALKLAGEFNQETVLNWRTGKLIPVPGYDPSKGNSYE
jgi:phage-related protein (TIGR01555 family)